MSDREQYDAGPANAGHVLKDGDKWTLVMIKELNHPPAKVWDALTDPEQLRAWAPFDASRNLATVGAVTLTVVGMGQVSETEVTKADPPHVLEYKWGGQDLRWKLEETSQGTKLTLWHNIDRGFISMGAAGWHICLDVLGNSLNGTPIGRIVGADALKFGQWQRLNKEYAEQFGVEAPQW